MCRQLCMPPQQISPSAASRSPWASAMSAAWRKVSAICLVFSAGFAAQSPGLAEESMRMTPYLRMPSSRSVRPMPQAFSTWVRNFFRSCSSPIADPPPVGGQTGATSEPTTSPRRPMPSASRLRSSGSHRSGCAGRRGTDRRRRSARRRPRSRRSGRASSRARSAARCPGPCRPGPATSRCEERDICGSWFQSLPASAASFSALAQASGEPASRLSSAAAEAGSCVVQLCGRLPDAGKRR